MSLPGVFALLVILQAPRAEIVGSVRDQSTGAPLPGALIRLPESGRSVRADGAGWYRLTGIPSGSHRLVAAALGHDSLDLTVLVPDTGVVRVDLALAPHAIPLPTLTVRPDLARLPGVASPWFPDLRVDAAGLRDNPHLAEPDPFLALDGVASATAPEAPAGLHLRGGGADQTAYELDGVPILNPFHAAGLFSAWDPDALAGLGVRSVPDPGSAPSLSGTVSARTRTDSATTLHTVLSSSHTGVTLGGPLGLAEGHVVVSLRQGFTGLLGHRGESSYLRGESGDALAAADFTIAGGRLHLLGYDNANELGARAASPVSVAPDSRRNRFEWESRSLGLSWSRSVAEDAELTVTAWQATAGAGARWGTDGGPLRLRSDRRDLGAAVFLGMGGGRHSLALRLEAPRTAYVVRDSGGPVAQRSTTTPVATLSLRETRTLGGHWILLAGADATAGAGQVGVGPLARVTWQPAGGFTASASFTRRRQFVQSLRDPESVAAAIFPAELWLGAGGDLPVARSDELLVSAAWATRTLQLGAMAYDRRLTDIVLTAPTAEAPFATGPLTIGAGRIRGAGLQVAWQAGPLLASAAYTREQVRYLAGGSSYAPAYTAGHRLRTGVRLRAGGSTSFHVTGTALLDRRTTALASSLGWEACNLSDRGCEFGGSPSHAGESLGATRLPTYLSLDVGARQELRLRVGGRETVLGLFGSVANLGARINVLTRERLAAGLGDIEMRPRAPVAVGLDWRY